MNLVEMQRELGVAKRAAVESNRAYGQACASLRAARDLADAAREVVATHGRHGTLDRLAVALTLWDAHSAELVGS